MRDRVLIFCGLALFVSFVTYPVWHGVASGNREPELARVAGQSSCVAPRSFMRQSHMALLNQWRNAKVRSGQRSFAAADGTPFVISLSGTCLTQCHGSAAEFCDRCHRYAGVPAPDCWHCHTSPPARQPGVARAAKEGVRR